MNYTQFKRYGYFTTAFSETNARIVGKLVESVLTVSNYPICIALNNATHVSYLPEHERVRPLILEWPDESEIFAAASADLYTPWERTFLIKPSFYVVDKTIDDKFNLLNDQDICVQTLHSIGADSSKYDCYNRLASRFNICWCPLQLYYPWCLFDSNVFTFELFSAWRIWLFEAMLHKLRNRWDPGYTFSFAMKHTQLKLNSTRVLDLKIYSKHLKRRALFCHRPIETVKEKAAVPHQASIPFEILKESAIEYNIPLELLPVANIIQ